MRVLIGARCGLAIDPKSEILQTRNRFDPCGMKTLPLYWLFALLVAIQAGAAQPENLLPGLLVMEYPRHEAQVDHANAYLDLEKFGSSIGHQSVTKSLAPWKWTAKRNAVAKGYLVVPEDGDYAFTTDSFYDRNLLMIDGKVVCGYIDGGDKVVTVPLQKGMVEIMSVGFIGSRGATQVRWRQPGQRELTPIPLSNLRHEPPSVLADWVTMVAKDFVVEVYKNGERVPDRDRQLLLDQFGACSERLNVGVKAGDWLVFHVVANRMRHQGSKCFLAAGCLDSGGLGFVTHPDNEAWSVCDDPAEAPSFIENRDFGATVRPSGIRNAWEEGLDHMREFAGADFGGVPVWGEESSTWLKFIAPGESPVDAVLAGWQGQTNSEEVDGPYRCLPGEVTGQFVAPIDLSEIEVIEGLIPEEAKPKAELSKTISDKDPLASNGTEFDLSSTPPLSEPDLDILTPKRWPVQILSAIYGTGGKDADVTARVKQLVEVERKALWAVNPVVLGADPNPYWNKGLHIVYIKDGVRREQHRNENEHVLAESFYGPQDAGELKRWIAGTRWAGPRGEIQFQENGTLTGTDIGRSASWEASKKNWLEITWAKDEVVRYAFDYVWSSFKDPDDAKNAYRILN